ncbi:MAG: transglycosylase SLT domain-containing protein [Nautiliaceae bacterium]
MRGVIFLLFFITSLFGDIFSIKNINVLNALDVDRSFLYYKPLQEKYYYYAHKKREFFFSIIERGVNFYPIIKEEIIKYNLPRELIAVAMAESYFSSRARSYKRAIGLWQFMPYTARQYGLRIDRYVDERRDPYKSTYAAIKYLKYLHDMFGKWYLAVMAYNAGEARVIEGVVRAKVDKICETLGKRRCRRDKMIRKYRRIIKNYQRRGVRGYRALKDLYSKLSFVNVSLKDLLRYQKGLRRQYFPQETRDYILKVIAMSFLFNDDEFLKSSNVYILNSGTSSRYVKVNIPPGTSLFYVAKILGISYSELKFHNPQLRYSFTPPYNYYIYIPYDKILIFKQKFKPRPVYIYLYRVRRGDSWRKIARKFGVSYKKLREYNKGKRLIRGRILFIPLTHKYIVYRVRRGDTLIKISRRFGVSVRRIKTVNHLRSNLLRVNQKLIIPH